MKISKQLLVSLLFTASLFLSAAHNIKHFSHSDENCPICVLHNYSDSGDITPEFSLDSESIAFEVPLTRDDLFVILDVYTLPNTRAPPFFS